MTKRLSVGLCAALILLGGCGHKDKRAGDAAANVSDIAANAAAGLEHTAGTLPDPGVANAVVNEATGIDNASGAAGNATQ